MFLRKSAPDAAALRGSATLAAATAALPMIWFDREGTILEANDKFCAAIGYSREEIVGQHHRMFLFPEEANSADYPKFWEELRAGKTQQRSFPRRRKSGDALVIEASYIPMRDAAGEVNGVVKIATDITETYRRMIREQAWIEAVQRSTAMIEFDPEGRIMSANALFCDAMGYKEADLIGQHHRMFMAPGEADKPGYQDFWASLRAGKFQSGEFLRVGQGGREIWIQASYNPVYNSRGKVFSVVKFAVDITRDKLSTLDAMGKMAAINRSYGVLEFDPEGRILSVNDTFLQAAGYAREELLGKPHAILLRPEERDMPSHTELWAALGRGEPREAEHCRKTKSGQDYWIHATYNPIHDSCGRLTKIVKISTDMTAQKQAISLFQDGVARLRDGDLTLRLRDRMPGDLDRLRINYNDALDRLAGLLGVILSGARSITEEVETLNGAAKELGRRTETQAASLEETAAAINELASSVESSSQGATEAAKAVTQARARSGEGKAVVEQTIGAMNDIAQSSEQISKITSVIDDIAFQTNLLALNAGVEAARAGETGRGFAVVASEVRALAQRSSEAAREIAELIATSERQVKTGVGLVDQSGRALAEIDALVGRLDEAIHGIANSAAEQSIGISEINSAVNQLDQVTQQNAAMFEETSAAVAMLAEQAQSLATESSVFRVEAAAPGAPGLRLAS